MALTELSLGGGTWILLVLLGGLLGVDSVSWPQAMISRPLIAATLGAWIMGEPAAGFLVGAVLELYAMRYPPYGAARYPDTGPAGLIAGASFAGAGGSQIGPLVVAVIAGWAIGWIGSRSAQALRFINERLVTGDPGLASRPAVFEVRHRTAIWLDVARGGLIVAAFMVPVAIAARLAVGVPGDGSVAAYSVVAVALGVAASVGAGGRNTAFGLRGWPLLLVGAAVTLVFVWLV